MVVYTHDAFSSLMEKTFETCRQLAKLKGAEYSGDTDRLLNFRRASTNLNISMETVWNIYVMKHIDSINQYCADIQAGKERERAEPIAERALDVIVYMTLFLAMVEERQGAQYPPPARNIDREGLIIPGETIREAILRYKAYVNSFYGKPPLDPKAWALLNYPEARSAFVTAWEGQERYEDQLDERDHD